VRQKGGDPDARGRPFQWVRLSFVEEGHLLARVGAQKWGAAGHLSAPLRVQRERTESQAIGARQSGAGQARRFSRLAAGSPAGISCVRLVFDYP